MRRAGAACASSRVSAAAIRSRKVLMAWASLYTRTPLDRADNKSAPRIEPSSFGGPARLVRLLRSTPVARTLLTPSHQREGGLRDEVASASRRHECPLLNRRAVN